jgi:hypothetical protein
MTYRATDRMGASIPEPSEKKMKESLSSLSRFDPEHPDVSLIHESEWSLSVFGSGLVVFENVETDEGPWHMISVPVSDTLKLWHLLAEGNLDELKQFPWVSGYGPHA